MNFIDLFAGCGGLSLGLMESGWTGMFGIEKDPYAFETLAHNLLRTNRALRYQWPDWLPHAPIEIGSFIEMYKDRLAQLRGSITLVVGGPPCQGFSFAGKRDPDDPRNLAFQHYLRTVDLIRPPLVLFENVAGIDSRFVNHEDSESRYRTVSAFSHRIKEELEKLGYTVFVDVIKALDFGVAQLRPRYFLIGIRSEAVKGHANVSVNSLDPFARLNVLRPDFLLSKNLPADGQVTVEQAISDLETSGKGLVPCEDSPRFDRIDYSGPQTSYQQMLHGEMNGAAPNSLRLARHRPQTVERFVSIYETCRKGVNLSTAERALHGMKKASFKILDPRKPSPTLTTLPDDILHYSEPRILTVREYARIQSFPDWFEFKGNYTTGGSRRKNECPRYTQVANAVPPLLAKALGATLSEICGELSGLGTLQAEPYQ